ncbi:hypothetical protein CAOG_009916 [Capsaspora owczarzaki ATCC 30864]|uniref:Uncharacterized protein n=1 Tax=Capsaspora owczarzaki (strain ATCC 30864) TaxID=595528 RepID=A0A0D2UJS7_CAPO3|nr:hypothetical protein CAOG_009916 [Capsaspora owczarzaki ATCC 30864]
MTGCPRPCASPDNRRIVPQRGVAAGRGWGGLQREYGARAERAVSFFICLVCVCRQKQQPGCSRAAAVRSPAAPAGVCARCDCNARSAVRRSSGLSGWMGCSR